MNRLHPVWGILWQAQSWAYLRILLEFNRFLLFFGASFFLLSYCRNLVGLIIIDFICKTPRYFGHLTLNKLSFLVNIEVSGVSCPLLHRVSRPIKHNSDWSFRREPITALQLAFRSFLVLISGLVLALISRFVLGLLSLFVIFVWMIVSFHFI